MLVFTALHYLAPKSDSFLSPSTALWLFPTLCNLFPPKYLHFPFAVTLLSMRPLPLFSAYFNQTHHSGLSLLFPTLYPSATWYLFYFTMHLSCFSLPHELVLNPLYVLQCFLAFFLPRVLHRALSINLFTTCFFSCFCFPRREKYNNKNSKLYDRTRCNLWIVRINL